MSSRRSPRFNFWNLTWSQAWMLMVMEWEMLAIIVYVLYAIFGHRF